MSKQSPDSISTSDPLKLENSLRSASLDTPPYLPPKSLILSLSATTFLLGAAGSWWATKRQLSEELPELTISRVQAEELIVKRLARVTAVKALALGTLLCLTGGGIFVVGVGMFMGVNNIHEFNVKMNQIFPESMKIKRENKNQSEQDVDELYKKFLSEGKEPRKILYTARHFYSAYTTNNDGLINTSIQTKNISARDLLTSDWGKDRLTWGTGDLMTEEFFLSKVFSESLQPSQVVPFYFRAEETPKDEDITITTLITADRFTVFNRLVNRYQGPISVTIHVIDEPETREDLLKDLHILYNSNPLMKKFVDVHLIMDKFERQFNMWRNIAKFFARTNYIMMLDVDFFLCTNFREKILNNEVIMEKLRALNTALVVPAFEYVNLEEGKDPTTFPSTKQVLLQEVQSGRLNMFHSSWVRGHGATNYSKYYETQELFKVTKYQYHYEPYVIFPQKTPWCDERFIGYGANKAACLFEIYISGVDYWVLPDDYLIHQTHKYPESARKYERKYNKKLYDQFREEICFRYARNFITNGEWETEKAANLKQECQKIRGFNQAIRFFASTG
ncbi:hypothetical protein G9A89_010875 [Geosiphon pyriformis]|nr:hypothetical protein G9A89_010875 [Geosiphon pyriformis]